MKKTINKDSLLSALKDNVREKEEFIRKVITENTMLKETLEKEVTKMPKAICEKCGKKYYGWALLYPEQQLCECGEKLEIKEEKK